jgi:antirestriction protein ArdC
MSIRLGLSHQPKEEAVSPKKDAYEVVTARIIEALEAGVVPWRRPWKNGGANIPRSLSTGKAYRGINVWTLSVTSLLQGYSSPYWVTFNQAKEAAVEAAIKAGREIVTKKSKRGTYYTEIVDGVEVAFRGGVRKGEEGTQIVLWKPIRVTEREKEQGKKDFLLLRYFTVFNVEQCDGVEAPTTIELNELDPIESAELIARDYTSVEVRHGGDSAHYQPISDYVQMPLLGQFESPERYYGVLFHELAHSTGHESRLNRDGITGSHVFGTPEYGREELVAELAGAFLCGQAGVDPQVEASAAYIENWLGVLKNDRKLLVQAARDAQKAADFVLGIEYKNGESNGESAPADSPSVIYNEEEIPVFSIEDHGTIVLIRPLSADVEAWLIAHTDGQWYGNALVVEPRYVGDLYDGLVAEGFAAQ